MTQKPYTKAPITEAVIEVRFASKHDQKKLEKVITKLGSLYSDYKPITNFSLEVKLTSDSKNTTNATPHHEHQFSSSDMTQMLIVKEASFLVAQLAPYQGWDEFIKRFTRDWVVWKSCMGYQQILRLGVRYINRIDIPITAANVEHERYLNIYPMLPEILSPLSSYAVHVTVDLTDINCQLTMNSAIVPSPLANYLSIVVDQDIGRNVEVPQQDNEIYSILTDIRTKKNSIFESCITDAARELFSDG